MANAVQLMALGIPWQVASLIGDDATAKPTTAQLMDVGVPPGLADALGDKVLYPAPTPALLVSLGMPPLHARSITLGGAPAPSVPAAPTLTATASAGQITLAWTDGANVGAPITSHKLFRGTTSGVLLLIGTISSGSPFVDTGLTNGQTYIYALSALNAAGESPLSVQASATPVASGGGTTPDLSTYSFLLGRNGSFETTSMAALKSYVNS